MPSMFVFVRLCVCAFVCMCVLPGWKYQTGAKGERGGETATDTCVTVCVNVSVYDVCVCACVCVFKKEDWGKGGVHQLSMPKLTTLSTTGLCRPVCVCVCV